MDEDDDEVKETCVSSGNGKHTAESRRRSGSSYSVETVLYSHTM